MSAYAGNTRGLEPSHRARCAMLVNTAPETGARAEGR